MRRLKKWLRKNEEGQSVVETALALPVLLLLLCGILDFGWIFANQYKVEYATGAGARYAAIHIDEASDPNAFRRSVASEVQRALPARSGTASVTVTVDQRKELVTVTTECPIRTLTFVANTIFGKYYRSSSSSTAAY